MVDTYNYIIDKYKINVGKQYLVDVEQMAGSADLSKLFAELKFNKGVEVGTDQGLFAELLSNTDQDLYAWLTGQEEPSNEAFKRMVKLIRQQPKTIF